MKPGDVLLVFIRHMSMRSLEPKRFMQTPVNVCIIVKRYSKKLLSCIRNLSQLSQPRRDAPGRRDPMGHYLYA